MMVLFTLSGCIAIDDNFAGYYHFKNVNGLGLSSYFDASSSPLSTRALGFACDDDVQCAFYNSNTGASSGCNKLYKWTFDVSFDSFLSNTTCGGDIKTATCSPSPRYLVCPNDYGVSEIATYQLPPELIASSCDRNPSCVGFTVNNDRTAGTLWSYGTSGCGPAYLKLPAANNLKNVKQPASMLEDKDMMA